LAQLSVGETGLLTGLTNQNTFIDEFDDEEDHAALNRSKREWVRTLKNRLETLIAQGLDSHAPLFANLSSLGQTLELTAVELELLTLRLLIDLIKPFRDG
jgi:hypothetical protein